MAHRDRPPWRLKPGSPARIESNSGLRLIHEVLGLEYSHPGLWDGAPVTFDNLKRAQQRFAEALLDWIPDDVRTVLDAGAGYGGIAKAMADRGLDVTGLNPDRYQKQAFEQRTGLPCLPARLQDIDPERRFDLVLMNGSCHNIGPTPLFTTVRKAAPGGYLLICDNFLLDNETAPRKRATYYFVRLLRAASENGLTLTREADLTEQVLPTYDFAADSLYDHVLPGIELVRDMALRRRPLISRIAFALFARKIEKLANQRRWFERDVYLQTRRFKRYLFSVPPAA
jgi:SAM-dependent methyltransferase